MFADTPGKPDPSELSNMIQGLLSNDDAEVILEQEAELLNHVTSSGVKVKGIAPMIKIYGIQNDGTRRTLIVSLSEIPEDSRLKHGMVHVMGRQFAQREGSVMPLALTLVTEAWVASQAPDAKEYVMPRDNPDRVEAAIITMMTFDGRTALRGYALRRRTDETVVLIPKPMMKYEIKEYQENVACTAPLLKEFFMGYALAKLGEPVPECYADVNIDVHEVKQPDATEEDDQS
jgi:hypothetical protein